MEERKTKSRDWRHCTLESGAQYRRRHPEYSLYVYTTLKGPYNITPPPSADRVEMRHHPVGTATTARLVVVCSSSAVSFIKENCWIASKYYSPTLDRLTYSETLGAFFIFIDGDDYLLCVCVSCPWGQTEFFLTDGRIDTHTHTSPVGTDDMGQISIYGPYWLSPASIRGISTKTLFYFYWHLLRIIAREGNSTHTHYGPVNQCGDIWVRYF